MSDIQWTGSGDLELTNTDVNKAANVLGVQLGSLEYLPNMGVDLEYFLSTDFKFQDQSFKSYIVQVLAANGINVASIISTVENLKENLDINLSASTKTTGLIAR